MRIGKSELISKVAKAFEGEEKVPSLKTEKGASAAVDAVFEGIKQLLVEHGKVNVPGFGTFVVRESKPRVARNPRTGETVKVGARKRVKFQSSGKLQKEMNS